MHGVVGNRKKSLFYFVALGMYVLSCTSKTMGITLPAALLLHDWLLLRPRPEGLKERLLGPPLRTGPFFLFAFLFAAFIVVPIGHRGLIREWFGGGIGPTYLSMANVLRTYGLETFVPVKLQACVDFPVTSSPDLRTALSAILLMGGLSFGLWVLFKTLLQARDPSLGTRLGAFCILFFFVALAPVSNLLFPIGSLYAERYLYLPLVGGPLLLAALVARAMGAGGFRPEPGRNRWRSGAALLGLGGILIVFGAKTIAYNRVWRDTTTLWRDVLEKSGKPHHQAHLSLGLATLKQIPGEDSARREALLESAEIHFRTALAHGHASLFYDPAMVHVPLSQVHAMKGELRKALLALSEAQTIVEKRIASFETSYLQSLQKAFLAKIRVDRGKLLFRFDDPDSLSEAEKEFHRAIEHYGMDLANDPEPENIVLMRGEVFVFLGNLEKKQGRDPASSYRKAVADLSEALAGNPHLVKAYSIRGSAHLNLASAEVSRGGDPRPLLLSAASDFTQTLRLDPENVDTIHHRGKVFRNLGEIEAHGGADPRPYYRKAIADFSRAIEANPRTMPVYNDRAICRTLLADADRTRGTDPRDEARRAITDFQTALELEPGFIPSLMGMGTTNLLLGDVEQAQGRRGTPYYEKALAAFQASIERDSSLGMAYAKKGLALEQLGRIEEAVRSYEIALALTRGEYPPLKGWLARAREKLPKAKPRDPSRIAFDLERADAAASRGDYEAAGLLYERVVATAGPGDAPFSLRSVFARASFQLARIRSLASVGKAGPKAAPRPLSRGAAEDLQRQALAHLEKALAYGWHDLDRIRTETDLAPIRSLPDFKALLRKWEGRRKDGD
ncbi:MAG: tetratricopeptide repeat protein, partial [Planctomycetota bacterium]|jgi:tetratricopeptide (TPR) repeat protein